MVCEPNIADWPRTFGDRSLAVRTGALAAKAPVLPDTSGPPMLACYSANALPKFVLRDNGWQPPRQEAGKRNRFNFFGPPFSLFAAQAGKSPSAGRRGRHRATFGKDLHVFHRLGKTRQPLRLVLFAGSIVGQH